VRILFVATKAPWPPRDGGRLLLLETLKALAPLGHEAHLVAPADGDGVDPSEAVRELSAFCVPHLVAAPRTGAFAAMVRSLRSGEPLSIARHARLALRAAASDQLAARAFDIVHAEQLQALDACAAAFTRVCRSSSARRTSRATCGPRRPGARAARALAAPRSRAPRSVRGESARTREADPRAHRS
jgi:hypothetical protein